MLRVMLAALLTAAAPATAAERAFPATGFDKVDLAAAAMVEVHAGGGFAIRATGDQKLLDRLDLVVRNGTLVIGWRPGSALTLRHSDALRIAVSMPRITAATVSGAGTIAVDRAEIPDFTATVDGAGTLRVAAMRARRATLKVGGAGQVVAAGAAERVDAHVSGVGSIDAAALAARAGFIDMAGAGSIKVHVNGPAYVTMGGLGSVRVLGRARCNVHKKGFGSVHCGA
jgi:hypothetical protein